MRRLASSRRCWSGSSYARICNAYSTPASACRSQSSRRGTGTAVWRLSVPRASPRSRRSATSALRFALQRSWSSGLAGWVARFVSSGSVIGFIGFRLYCPVSKKIGGGIFFVAHPDQSARLRWWFPLTNYALHPLVRSSTVQDRSIAATQSAHDRFISESISLWTSGFAHRNIRDSFCG